MKGRINKKATSVYFKNQEEKKELDEMAKEFPGSSSSLIIQQLISGLVKANKDREPGTRQVHLVMDVYL